MGGRWLLECLTRRVKDIDVEGGGDRDTGDLPHPSSFERNPHAGAGHDIGSTPELLGHSDVSATMHCTHVLNRDERGFGDRWAGGAPVIGYCGGSCRTGDGGRTIPCRLIDS